MDLVRLYSSRKTSLGELHVFRRGRSGPGDGQVGDQKGSSYGVWVLP